MIFCRVLVQNVKRFSNQVKKVTWHIPSKHEKEMAAKSVVVNIAINVIANYEHVFIGPIRCGVQE